MGNGEDCQLTENSISRFGLRTMEVIRYGQAVTIGPWLQMVPGEARELVTVTRRYEQGINVHHAIITWNAREMVEFQQTPVRYGVLWWIGKGERMSNAIDLAASLYKLKTGIYPTRCWVNDLPKDAPDSYQIEGFTKDPPTKPVTLRIANFVPAKFVCVGIESRELEIEFKDGKYIPAGGNSHGK